MQFITFVIIGFCLIAILFHISKLGKVLACILLIVHFLITIMAGNVNPIQHFNEFSTLSKPVEYVTDGPYLVSTNKKHILTNKNTYTVKTYPTTGKSKIIVQKRIAKESATSLEKDYLNYLQSDKSSQQAGKISYYKHIK